MITAVSGGVVSGNRTYVQDSVPLKERQGVDRPAYHGRMKHCATCKREYLDSYESCPFCERAAAPLPKMDAAAEWRSQVTIRIGGGVLIVIVVVVAWQLWAGFLASTGMGKALQAKCFAMQSEVERAALSYSAAHGGVPVTDLSVLVPSGFEALPKCPAQGGYTFSWDPRLPRCACSKHGWHGGPP